MHMEWCILQCVRRFWHSRSRQICAKLIGTGRIAHQVRQLSLHLWSGCHDIDATSQQGGESDVRPVWGFFVAGEGLRGEASVRHTSPSTAAS